MITDYEKLEKLKMSYSPVQEKMKKLSINYTEYLHAKEKFDSSIKIKNRLKLDKIEGLLEKCILGIEPEETEKSHKM